MNPVNISWKNAANVTECEEDCSIKIKYPSGENTYTKETSDNAITLKPNNTHIVKTAYEYRLTEIKISKKTLNFYKSGTSPQMDENYIEIILVHNETSDANKKLYICFLVQKSETAPGDLDQRISYNYFDKLANELTKNKVTIKDETLLNIIPKTSYYKLDGGEWDGLFGGGKGTHEFFLFPEGSNVKASSDFFHQITTSWPFINNDVTGTSDDDKKTNKYRSNTS